MAKRRSDVPGRVWKATAGYGEKVLWIAGGTLMIVLGTAVVLDGWGVGGALWRFWQSSYRRLGLASRRSEMFVRGWFGLLLVVIGAGWIVVGAS